MGPPPEGEGVQPAVGRGIGSLTREPTRAAAEENEQNQSNGCAAVASCRCQAPCTLGAQSRSMSSSVMLAKVASSTTAAACSTPRSGSPVAVAVATNRCAVPAWAMSPHSTTTSEPIARTSSIVSNAFWVGREREVSTMRAAPALAIFSARNKPRPPRPPVMM